LDMAGYLHKIPAIYAFIILYTIIWRKTTKGDL
jgi:hypothetical protein